MSTLGWIVLSGILMSALALVGSVTLMLPERTFKKLVLPMVSLAAGSLLGGALFHMLPEAIDEIGNRLALYVWLGAGIVSFFVLEQYLHWHHCHVFGADLLVKRSGDRFVLGRHRGPVGRGIYPQRLPVPRGEAEQHRLLFRRGDAPQPDHPRHNQVSRRVPPPRRHDTQLVAIRDHVLGEAVTGKHPTCRLRAPEASSSRDQPDRTAPIHRHPQRTCD